MTARSKSMGDEANKFISKDRKDVFLKRKWRERKHSKKFQIQQKEENKKKFLERRFKKELKKEGLTVSNNSGERENKQRISRIKEAQLEYEERKKKQAEAKRIKEEKQLLIKKKREKKAELHKKLNQKTRRGQPLMRARLELLQQKIQKMADENKL